MKSNAYLPAIGLAILCSTCAAVAATRSFEPQKRLPTNYEPGRKEFSIRIGLRMPQAATCLLSLPTLKKTGEGLTAFEVGTYERKEACTALQSNTQYLWPDGQKGEIAYQSGEWRLISMAAEDTQDLQVFPVFEGMRKVKQGAQCYEVLTAIQPETVTKVYGDPQLHAIRKTVFVTTESVKSTCTPDGA